MKKNLTKLITATVLIAVITGCTNNIPTPKQRLDTTQKIITQNNYTSSVFSTQEFEIFSVSFNLELSNTINAYIEGDGLAWVTRTRISSNPTPINPLALKLMAKDTSKSKIYLARVCQYVNDKKCSKKYWTSHRYASEVISSYNELFNQLKNKYKNIKNFNLYGYSGGAAIALLVASKRDDINKVVTIAGNIDIEHWTKRKNITPLYGSLNPANFTQKLSQIKQYHLIGGKDNIIDKTNFDSYYQKSMIKKNIQYKLFKDFTHSKGWLYNWSDILVNLD